MIYIMKTRQRILRDNDVLYYYVLSLCMNKRQVEGGVEAASSLYVVRSCTVTPVQSPGR